MNQACAFAVPAVTAAMMLLPQPGFAQTSTAAEDAVIPRIISTLCLDLVEVRLGCETAVLLVSETEPDAADLIIYSDRRAEAAQEVLAIARGIAFDGPIFGQAPVLEQAENGSLLLRAEQVGIGRNPWSLTLTIVHRDEGFLVAGLTYTTYDRLFAGVFSCDVNMLTGDWDVYAEHPNPDEAVLEPVYDVTLSGRIAGTRPSLSDWTLDTPLPGPCEDGLTAWSRAAPE